MSSSSAAYPKVAKLEVDSDCEIIDEKLISPQNSNKFNRVGDVGTSASALPPVNQELKPTIFTQKGSRKRPADTPIELIDIEDEDLSSGLGSSWKTASSRSTNGSVVSLPSIIPLASSPKPSDDGSPQPHKNDKVSEVVSVYSAMGKRAAMSKKFTDSGIPPEYLNNLFRPITTYVNKHQKAMETFNRQIWRHFAENLQNDKTFTWKMRVRFMLHQLISKMQKDCHLIAVGSTINGCGAYNSDMDLCLCVRETGNAAYNTDRNYAVKTLKKMQKLLKGVSFIRKFNVIPARVPILKLWFNAPYEALEVDLNVNNTAGIYNSYLLHYYSRIDDRCSALCLLVKHWAKLAGIGDAFNGTFNSYSLILMVVHFLQVVCSPPVLPNLQKLYPTVFTQNLPLSSMTLFGELPQPLKMDPRNTQSIGELAIAFFKYYAEFDYDNYAISIANACIFSRNNLCNSTRRFKIFIEEPFDQQNTARCITSSDCWERIHKAIRKAANLFLGKYATAPDLNVFLSNFSN